MAASPSLFDGLLGEDPLLLQVRGGP